MTAFTPLALRSNVRTASEVSVHLPNYVEAKITCATNDVALRLKDLERDPDIGVYKIDRTSAQHIAKARRGKPYLAFA